MKHKTAGVVTSVSAHHSMPDMLQVDVAHGRRKKPKKGEVMSYDDRPSSRLTIPKTHSAHYPVGKSVHVGIAPRSSKRGGGDSYDKTVRNIITGGKKK